jgi:hypothetical protein
LLVAVGKGPAWIGVGQVGLRAIVAALGAELPFSTGPDPQVGIQSSTNGGSSTDRRFRTGTRPKSTSCPLFFAMCS